MTIIGISGKKGSGKSTVAAKLLEELPHAMPINFADRLKAIVRDCFGATATQTEGSNAHKEQLLPCGITVRKALQEVGQHFRVMDGNVWVRAWKNAVSEADVIYSVDTVVCADVRYPNEVQAIHDMGGKVVRLARAPHADAHISETALDEVPEGREGREGSRVYFDKVVRNEKQTEEQTVGEVVDWLMERGLV